MEALRVISYMLCLLLSLSLDGHAGRNAFLQSPSVGVLYKHQPLLKECARFQQRIGRLRNFFSSQSCHAASSIKRKSQLKAFELDEQDDEFFGRIGIPRTSSLAAVTKAFNKTAEKLENPKDRLALKDKWIDVSQKVIKGEIEKFNRISKRSRYIPSDTKLPMSEFSPEFLKSVNWPESAKDKIRQIADHNLRAGSTLFGIEGGLLKRPSLSKAVMLCKYFIPISICGGLVSKLAAPSVAACTMLAAAVISRDDKIKTEKEKSGQTDGKSTPNLTSMGLTTLIIAFHESLGALTAFLLPKWVAQASRMSAEGLMAAAVNLQLLLAALFYKTYIPSENSTGL